MGSPRDFKKPVSIRGREFIGLSCGNEYAIHLVAVLGGSTNRIFITSLCIKSIYIIVALALPSCRPSGCAVAALLL
jgi:hypothetical protein